VSRTSDLRAFARRLRGAQGRLTVLADRAHALGFELTMGPDLLRQAHDISLYRLTVDAICDAQRDKRGSRPRT
jgi:hypothetical protein